jgi:hypothetical protein
MQENLRRHVPTAAIDGYLISKMVAEGTDCIVGAHRDPVFGNVVMFGLGGTLVEVLGDTVFRLAPVTAADAREMIEGIKGRRLLDGYRGGAKSDLEALTDAIVAIGRLAVTLGPRLISIEVNPLRVLPAGQGIAMLDAVVQVAPRQM